MHIVKGRTGCIGKSERMRGRGTLRRSRTDIGNYFEFRGNGSRDWRVDEREEHSLGSCSVGLDVPSFWRGVGWRDLRKGFLIRREDKFEDSRSQRSGCCHSCSS